MDAEVPHAEVDRFIGDDFHEGELAEVERLFGSDLEPVAAREEFAGGLDDVLLSLACAEQRDADAVDDTRAGADVGADDDVTACRRAAAGRWMPCI